MNEQTEAFGSRAAEINSMLAAIVDSSDDAIVSKSIEGIVTSWNKGAERIFGFLAAEMIGQPITKIIPQDRLHEETEILRRIRAGERVDHFETIRQRKDGTLIDVSVTISPMRDETGTIIGASKIARDVTMQKSVQRELVPRVSAYAGYSRRWYGNLFATRNLAVSNADFTPYCVTLPANDSRLPGTGTQQCGYFDVNRNIAPNNLIFNSSKVGGIDDIYDGFDFDVNARLPGNALISGGLSWGRERINTCTLKDDLSLTAPASARTSDPRADAFCDTHPNWNPQIKGQVAYRLPWDISFSATYQSLSGPEIRAQCPVNSTVSGAPLCPASLSRPFTGAAPTVDIVSAGLIYGDRIYQTDIRFSRTIRTGHTTVRPTVSVYNLFNSNAVQTYTNTYGLAWQAPQTIMQSRFVDIGVQVDF